MYGSMFIQYNEIYATFSLLAAKSATGLMEWADVSTALGALMLMNHAVVRNEGMQI